MKNRFRRFLSCVFVVGVLVQSVNAVASAGEENTTEPDTVVCGSSLEVTLDGKTKRITATYKAPTKSGTWTSSERGEFTYVLHYATGNAKNYLTDIDETINPSGAKLTVTNVKNYTYTWYKKSVKEEDFTQIEGESTFQYTPNIYNNQDVFRLVRTSPGGYCSDTIEWDVVFAPELELVISSDQSSGIVVEQKELSFYANDECKAKFRGFDYLPSFGFSSPSTVPSDYDMSDTVAYYWREEKSGDGIALGPTDSVEVQSGEKLFMTVGLRYYDVREGKKKENFPSAFDNMWRTVTLTDTARPKIVAPLSDGNIYHSVGVNDSASGVVPFSVTEAEIRNSVSDNCTATESLKLSYSLDKGSTYNDFSGFNSMLNVYTQPTQTVSYKVADEAGNERIADVTYEVERKTLHEGVQYAVVRDTTVESSKIPFVWHGVTFEGEGVTQVVGAAHLTLHVAKQKEIDTTMVICAASYTYEGQIYQKGKSQFKYIGKDAYGNEVTYNVDLYVVGEIDGFSKDTVRKEVCANDVEYIGFDDVAEKTSVRWYDDEVENASAYNVKKRDIRIDGLSDRIYKAIYTSTEGYCPDTAVFALNVGHNFEISQTSSIAVNSDDNCIANVLVREYAPKVKDLCGIAAFDTVTYISVNNGETIKVEKDTRYEFEDGDQVKWTVGTEKTTVSTTQTVSVTDATAPVIAVEGISYGNTVKSVGDSATGIVKFNVPLTDVTEHVSDNCTSSQDLKIEYSLDGSTFNSFNGEDFVLNVYTQPTLSVSYKITDKAGNPTTSVVTYEVERKTMFDGVQYAVVRDTTVKLSKVPFVWHGVTFNEDGETQVVGAAHLTLHIAKPVSVDTSMVICDATYSVNGQSYEKGRHSFTYTVEYENGADTTFNVSLFVVGVIKDFSKDTVVSYSCGPSLKYIGYEDIAEKTTVRWFDNEIENNDVRNNKRRDIHTDGITDNLYKVIYSTSEGYCPDTAYYLLAAEHDFEINKVKSMNFYANDDCKAHVLLRDYAPSVNDLCITTEFDTVVYITVNEGERFKVKDDTYYDFVDGDNVYWSVGLENDGAGQFQTVSVIDTISPSISVDGISLGKRKIPVSDTITGAVDFNISLEDIRENISDNCTSVSDLTIEYGLDGNTFLPFSGEKFTLNAFNKTDLTVYFYVSDKSGNKKIASVTYEIDRDADGYAFTRDTFVCNGELPLRWYGSDFATSGESIEIGAVRLTVHERDLRERTQTEVACDNFEWIDGKTYTESTKSVFVKENGIGLCDSIIRLDLTILKTTYGEDVQNVCEKDLPLVWNGYEVTSDTTIIMQNEAGCDSILTLKMNVLKTTYGEDVQNVCEKDLPLVWNGFEVTTDTTIVVQNEAGCDSILTLKLNVLKTTYGEDVQNVCEKDLPLVWNGYEVTSDTTIIMQNEAGCDSILTLKMNVLKTTYGEDVQNVCEKDLPLVWNGFEVTTDTTIVVQNEAGCDSILTLKLNVLKTTYGEDVQYVCEKDLPLVWNGFEVTSDTTIVALNEAGCDSILTLKLNVLKTTYGEDVQYVCEKDLPLVWNGFEVTSDTTIVALNEAGCDSILTLKLNVLKTTYGEDVQNVCEKDLPLVWNGFEVASDTTIVVQNEAGCDSILTLKLNVLKSTYGAEELTVCESSLPIEWNGFKVEKDTTIVLENVAKCDSVVSLKLEVNPTLRSEFSAVGESVYIWNNKVYTKSGVYRDTFTSVTGCDSVVTMKLQITYKNVPITERVISCGSYLWNDTLLEESGLYFDTIPTLKGDSVISIMLTVNKPTYAKDTIVRNHCQSEMPVFWEGNLLDPGMNTFHLENHLGCDSIVYVRLNVWPLYNDTLTIHACDAFVMNGRTLTESGVYTDTLSSMTGCDSIVTVNLTVNSSYETEAVDTVFVGDTYTEYGFNLTFEKDQILEKNVYLETESGCDSLIHLTLVVRSKKFEIELTNVTGGFETIDGNIVFCEEHNVEINYHITSGKADAYRVMFDAEAVSQGFREIEGEVTDTVGTIKFSVPEDVFPDSYKAFVQFYDDGYASDQVIAPFYVGYGSDIFAVNSKNEISLKDNIYGFSDFQWYKNGVAIVGANSMTYQEPQMLDGVYVLGVKTVDGVETVVCGKQTKGAENLNIWIANSTSISRGGATILYVEGLTSAEMERTKFMVYSLAGVELLVLNGVTKENVLNLNSGVYVGIMKLDDTLKYIKFIAE